MNQPKKKIKKEVSQEDKRKNILLYLGICLIVLGIGSMLGILNYKDEDLKLKSFSLSVPYVFMASGLFLILIDNLPYIGDIIKSIFRRDK